MTPENFCYWLRGYVELSTQDVIDLTPKQVQIINDHLELVMKKITPSEDKGERNTETVYDPFDTNFLDTKLICHLTC